MTKHNWVKILLYLFLLFIINPMVEPELIIQVPDDVHGGKDFVVNITLKKEKIEGFSRFIMELPAGLIAEPLNSANADFTFSDKKVRLIWLKIPSSNEINFSFKVKVDPRLKGKFTLNSSFSYILNNEKKTISVSTKTVNIIPSPEIDPSMLVDINEYESKVIEYIKPFTEDLKNVACIRQKPEYNKEKNEYIVKLLIQKGGNYKYAKVEEKIPKGFKAISVDPKFAIFVFKNNVLKLLWMNLPPENPFIVQYKLIPLSSDNTISVPEFEGTFSYLTDGKTLTIPVYQTSKDLALLTPEEINNISEIQTTKPSIAQFQSSTSIKPSYTYKEKLSTTQNIETKEKLTGTKGSFDLMPSEGIYFRVQIAAGRKPVYKNYFKKFKLDKEVFREFHDGWYKYTLGNFSIYKEARDYRNYLRNNTNFKDAFVIAYNNGIRITVQEALMISNQRWYK